MASKGKKRFKGPAAKPPSMMQQLQEMQNQMAQAQDSLADEVVTASVGGGTVTVEMTGSQELRSVKIAPEVVDPDDVEMLEDLIMAAFKEASDKAQQLASDRLSPLAGGIDIPGLL